MTRLPVPLLAEALVGAVGDAEDVEGVAEEEMAEAVVIPQDVVEGDAVARLLNKDQQMLIVILVVDGQTEFILAQ